MEFLKEILGEDYGKFEERINTYNSAEENKDNQIKLGNLSSGEYVSKDKYVTLEKEVGSYKTQLEDANKNIESFKGMDIEGIQKAADEWKQKYETETGKLQGELEKERKTHAADKFLSGYNFTSTLAKEAALNKFLGQDLKFTDGKFEGGESFIEQLQKEDPASFKQKEEEKPQPRKWATGTKGNYKPPVEGEEEAHLKAKYGNNKYYK